MSSVVPTTRTRDIAAVMVKYAEIQTGADSVVRYLNHVPNDQVPALIGVLLTYTKATKKQGRPPKPLRFTERERLDANARYKRGDRDPETVSAWREYQRVTQRRRTERIGRFGR